MTLRGQKNGTATIAQPAVTGGATTIRAVLGGTQSSRVQPTHKDPHTQRMLVELHNRILALEVAAALFAGARLHTGLAFTGGTAKTFAHQLGRPYRGYIPFSNGAAAVLVVQTLPTGYASDRYISLLSATSGTFDVLVL